MIFSLAIAPFAPSKYPAIYKQDLIEAVDKAAQMGYQGIEWHLRQPDFHAAEKLAKHCAGLNMTVTSLGTGMGCVFDGLTLTHADPEVRMRAVERLQEFVRLGEMLNSLVIIGSMRGVIPDMNQYELFESCFTDSLEQVMADAERKKVTVVLEALNRYESNFLNTLGQAGAYITRFGSRYLKIHADTFHMNIEEPDICQSLEKCGDSLGHMHFADSNRYFPGSGHLDFKSILSTVEKIHYRGCAAIECLPGCEPDADARLAIEHLTALAGSIHADLS